MTIDFLLGFLQDDPAGPKPEAAGPKPTGDLAGVTPENAGESIVRMVESAGSVHMVMLLTIFILACFVGYQVISRVPPTLHTPLMSGSNAISGVTIIGALLAAGSGSSTFVAILGFLAIVFATINVVGGFLVTHRMLGMFHGRKGRTS